MTGHFRRQADRLSIDHTDHRYKHYGFVAEAVLALGDRDCRADGHRRRSALSLYPNKFAEAQS